MLVQEESPVLSSDLCLVMAFVSFLVSENGDLALLDVCMDALLATVGNFREVFDCEEFIWVVALSLWHDDASFLSIVFFLITLLLLFLDILIYCSWDCLDCGAMHLIKLQCSVCQDIYEEIL